MKTMPAPLLAAQPARPHVKVLGQLLKYIPRAIVNGAAARHGVDFFCKEFALRGWRRGRDGERAGLVPCSSPTPPAGVCAASTKGALPPINRQYAVRPGADCRGGASRPMLRIVRSFFYTLRLPDQFQ